MTSGSTSPAIRERPRVGEGFGRTEGNFTLQTAGCHMVHSENPTENHGKRRKRKKKDTVHYLLPLREEEDKRNAFDLYEFLQ